MLKPIDGADYIVIPSNDHFLGEYVHPAYRYLEKISGFTGSNGALLIGATEFIFFTDGRYSEQARQQLSHLGKNLVIYDNLSIGDWLTSRKNKTKLAFDYSLHSINQIGKWLPLINPIEISLKGLVEINIPPPDSTPFICSKNHNIAKFLRYLKQKKLDGFYVASPDSVGYLLGIRAADLPYTPVLLATALVLKSGKITLFVENLAVRQIPSLEHCNVKLLDLASLPQEILHHTGKISYDPSVTNYKFLSCLEQTGVEISDPLLAMRAVKNRKEIAGMKKAHLQDGVALTKFLNYFDSQSARETELSLAERLLALRKLSPDFKMPSFASISSFKEHGAIIHYQPTEATNKSIDGSGVYLIDSGGQYFDGDFGGTTDVTRTLFFGHDNDMPPNLKLHYTLVLKGHIALASAKFPIGTGGSALDSLARQFLWQFGLDYAHGTGHGVGSFASVHEGPHRISKRGGDVALEVGMIVSNEPGYYLTGHYGIRIESLMLVRLARKLKGFLEFETLTLAPISSRMIDFTLITPDELSWLNNYHRTLRRKLAPHLSDRL